MKKVKAGKSKIHGNGLIADEPIRRGDVIELVHTIREIEPGVRKTTPTLLGRNYNHSEEPNSMNVIDGDNRYLVALKEIEVGGEITTDYRNNPDLEQPDSFTSNDNYVSFDYDDTLTTPEGFKLAKQMVSEGNNLYVITARDKMSPQMIERAKAAGIPKENIILAGSDEQKVKIVKDNNISKHIDNKESVIKALGKTGELFDPGKYPDLKADFIDMDLSDEDLNQLKKGGFIIDQYPDGGIVEYNGYKYKQDQSGNWTFANSGAPVTDKLMIQKITYEGKPVGSSAVQGAPKPKAISPVTKRQELETIKNSPVIADQRKATQLQDEIRNENIYFPTGQPAEDDTNYIEGLVNSALDYPMSKAALSAEFATNEGQVDNYRHANAGRYTAEAIKDMTGNIPYLSDAAAIIGANALGLGHEVGTWFTNTDDTKPWTSKLKESGEDMYNNFIGTTIGVSDMTPVEKTDKLLNLSYSNQLPDGYVKDPRAPRNVPNNMYFKHGPNDPGKYKPRYPDGGQTKRTKEKFIPGTYDPKETAGYELTEEEVTVPIKTSAWGKAINKYEKNNSEEDFIDKKKKQFLKKNKELNELYGVDTKNFPKDVEENFRKEYDYKKNTAVVKKVGRQEGWNPNRREQYVDDLNDPQRGIVAESKFGSKLQPSYWNRSLAGVQELGNTLLPGQPFQYNIPGLTKKEQKEMRDSKLSALETLAPLDIPGAVIANQIKNVGLTTGSNYKEQPALYSGEKMANVSDTEAMAFNPITYAGLESIPQVGMNLIKGTYQGAKSTASELARFFEEVPKELPGSPNTFRTVYPQVITSPTTGFKQYGNTTLLNFERPAPPAGYMRYNNSTWKDSDLLPLDQQPFALPIEELMTRAPWRYLSKDQEIMNSFKSGARAQERPVEIPKEFNTQEDIMARALGKPLPERVSRASLEPKIYYDIDGNVIDDPLKSGFDGNFLTRPLTPFTKNELTTLPNKNLKYRKIGNKAGLQDLINKGGAQAPAPMRMKSGLTADTPFFGMGKKPSEDYKGIFAVELKPDNSKYNWSSRVAGTDNYGVAPFDKVTGRSIKNVPLEDLNVYRKKFLSNNYKKLDPNNLEEGLKYAQAQVLAEQAYKWGIRGVTADQIFNDGDYRKQLQNAISNKLENNKKEGGSLNYMVKELTPEEIEEYRRGGYIVEDY